jgi:hypothetical protein
MVVAVKTLRFVQRGAKEKARPAHFRASGRALGAALPVITSISTNAPTSSTAPKTCPSTPLVAFIPTPRRVSAETSARIWAS